MYVTGPKFTEWFKANNPTLLGTHTNNKGQEIKFFEHPTKGDEACVYGEIEGVVFNTEFFETDDMMADDGEYTPHLVDGKVYCGFELED